MAVLADCAHTVRPMEWIARQSSTPKILGIMAALGTLGLWISGTSIL